MARKIKFDKKTFAVALDRIATDKKFSQDLNARPVETLNAIGIVLPSEKAAELKGKTLSDLIRFESGGPNVAVQVLVGISFVGQVREASVRNVEQAVKRAIGPSRPKQGKRKAVGPSRAITRKRKSYRGK